MTEQFRFKKSMGQHFLLDAQLIERLADAARVTRLDGVLEVGPGSGLFTQALAKRARRVIAVELDRTLIQTLQKTLAPYPNTEVVEGDILKTDLAQLQQALGVPCRVAANIPYNITTQLLEKLLFSRLPFLTMAIMVQKEVGERMMAQAGQSGYGPLSIFIDIFATVSEALVVPASCFTPRPQVDSSFMLLTLRKEAKIAKDEEPAFLKLVNAAFAQRRKTLLNNLEMGTPLNREQIITILDTLGLPVTVRAEQLTTEILQTLAVAIFSNS